MEEKEPIAMPDARARIPTSRIAKTGETVFHTGCVKSGSGAGFRGEASQRGRLTADSPFSFKPCFIEVTRPPSRQWCVGDRYRSSGSWAGAAWRRSTWRATASTTAPSRSRSCARRSSAGQGGPALSARDPDPRAAAAPPHPRPARLRHHRRGVAPAVLRHAVRGRRDPAPAAHSRGPAPRALRRCAWCGRPARRSTTPTGKG